MQCCGRKKTCEGFCDSCSLHSNTTQKRGSSTLKEVIVKIEGVAHINLDIQGARMFEGMMQPIVQNIPVCHFMRAEYFISLLSSSQLRLRRSDLFMDLDEGTFVKSALKNPLRNAFSGFQLESDEKKVRENQELDRMCRFIHCWFADEPESEFMWENYGDHSRGVCLLSSTAKIRSAVKSRDHVSCEIHAVTYCDENNPAMELHSSLPYCRKRKQFQAEKEIRLLATMELSHPFLRGADLPDNKWPDHIELDVNLQTMLTGILFGPSIGSGDAVRISDLVNTRLRGIACSKSIIVLTQTDGVAHTDVPRQA